MPVHLSPSHLFLRPTFVRPVGVDPAGLAGPTKAQAAGPRWRKTSLGRYVPAEVDPAVPEQRAVEAVGHLPSGGALTGWAVLRLLGCRFFDGVTALGTPLPVRLQMGPHRGRRKRRGIQRRYDPVHGRMDVDDVPCVPLAWAVFDEMRSQDLLHAVVTLDMALVTRLISMQEVCHFVAGRAGCTGVPLVRDALALGDAHSGSPQETRLRLVWQVSLGLPRPLANVGVFGLDGRLLGYPDLLDVEAGLAVEYDGKEHRDARRHSADVEREAALREVGLEVTRVTGRDLLDPVGLGRRLMAARGRARFEPPEGRQWTLEPPGPVSY